MALTDTIKAKLMKNRWKAFYRNNKLPEISLGDIGIRHKIFSPAITEEICLPPYRGNEDFDDYSVLFSILDSQRPKVILELGTGYGNTVANICSTFGSKVITVNALPDQISGRVTTYVLTSEEIGKVYRSHGFSHRVVQVFEDTKKMYLNKYILQASVNLVIIDACHDPDYVLNDFQKILPFISSGSIVLLHDTHPSMRDHYMNSYLACMYLRKLGHNIRYVKGTSWAIWFEDDRNVHNSKVMQAFSSFANAIDRLIFGSQQIDLLRIRSHAKKLITE